MVRYKLGAQKLLSSHSELLRNSLERLFWTQNPSPAMEKMLYSPMWVEHLPAAPCLWPSLNYSPSGFPCKEKSVFFPDWETLFLFLQPCSFFFITAGKREQKYRHRQNVTVFSLVGNLGQYFALRSVPQLSSLLERLTTVLISLCDKSTVVKGCFQMVIAGIWEYTHI